MDERIHERIHERLDEMFRVQAEQGVILERNAGVSERIEQQLRSYMATREDTCPRAGDMAELAGRLAQAEFKLSILGPIGAVLVAALAIPAVKTVGERLWEVLFGG